MFNNLTSKALELNMLLALLLLVIIKAVGVIILGLVVFVLVSTIVNKFTMVGNHTCLTY